MWIFIIVIIGVLFVAGWMIIKALSKWYKNKQLLKQKEEERRKYLKQKEEERRKYLKVLETIVKNFRIYIDTCSLMKKDEFEKFWLDIEPLLQREKKKVFILNQVYGEVNHHIENRDEGDADRYEKAVYAKAKLDALQQNNLVEKVRQYNGIRHADMVFLLEFTRLSQVDNLILITQDNNLTDDIVNHISRFQSVKAREPEKQKKMLAKKINKNGRLNVLGSKFLSTDNTGAKKHRHR